MKSSFLLLLVAAFLGCAVVENCEDGWENFKNQKCIKYFAVNSNHQQARELCNNSGASLLSIWTFEEQDFVEQIAKRHSKQSGVHWVWIGATRPHEQTNQFVWENGVEVNFTRWRGGCPDSRTGENCVLMTVFRDRVSHWCNFKCDTNYDHVLCEKNYTKHEDTPATVRIEDLPEFDGPCPVGWEEHKNKCYKFHNANVTGDESRHICKYAYNATLVSIHSEDEMAFLTEFLFYQNGAPEAAWIGLKRKTTNSSTFLWVDGSPVDYLNWGLNEPDNRYVAGPENCVIINDVKPNFGRWVDVPCHLEFLLVCQKDAKRDKRSSTEPSFAAETTPADSIASNSGTDASAAQASQLDVKNGNVCTHSFWWVLLVLALIMIIASSVAVLYVYRNKWYTNNRYLSQLNFANIQYDSRTGNEYNQDIEEPDHYSQISYSPYKRSTVPDSNI